jgi:pimeloyl-ACP methyl ester carboxylesterase
MQVAVNGTTLWFDVNGPALLPAGATMAARPTVVLVHGGPGGYDHSYFWPEFARLSALAQVVSVDLREHGRSARGDPATFTYEHCADDVVALCDVLGIARPIVLGHSMGGFVAMLAGIRHPGRLGGLVLVSTFARCDLDRIADGFRRVGGDEIGELARRDFGGDDVTDEESSRVSAVFGPNTPSPERLARVVRNPAVNGPGMERMRELDVVEDLGAIDCPTLVCVGELDPVAPVEASREIVAALQPALGKLAVISGAGHFPWLDEQERFWAVIEAFMAGLAPGGHDR